MGCPSCGETTNPTLVYCIHCGAALDMESLAAEMIGDQEDRARAMRLVQAVREARSLAILTGLAFLVALATRVVLVQAPDYDHTPAYRVPYRVVKAAVREPTNVVPTTELEIPIPEGE